MAAERGEPVAEWPERFVTRIVTVRIVDNLYETPSDKQPRLQVGEEVEIRTLGWWEKVEEDALFPVQVEHGALLVPNERYVAALMFESGEWAFLNPDSAVAFAKDSERLPAEGEDGFLESDAAASLAGLDADGIREVMRTTPLLDGADAFMDLPPFQRIREVARAGEAGSR